MKFTNAAVVAMSALSFARNAWALDETKEVSTGFEATEETCAEIEDGLMDALFAMVEDFSKEELQEFLCSSVERNDNMLPAVMDPIKAIGEEYGEYAPCVDMIFADFIEDLQDPDLHDRDLGFALDADECKKEVGDEVDLIQHARRTRNLRGADRKLFLSWLIPKIPAIVGWVSRGRSFICRRWRIRFIC